jgi:DNA modification methylase
MSESFLGGKVTLHRGDCLEVLPLLDADSIDSCVTDPPYGLLFMGKGWDSVDNLAFRPELWAEVLRVLKPGAHLLAFSSTRTYHRMACAIEDAGFEIRDQIGWCYGSGFPKNHDVSKGIDRSLGRKRTIKTGTKPGHENFVGRDNHPLNGGWDRPWAYDAEAVGRYHSTFAPASDEAEQWQGWGTALKPAWEPLCLARKPLSESSIAANVLKHGTGGINVDGCRVGVDPVADASQLRTMQRGQRDSDTSGQTWGLSKNGSDQPQVVRHDGRWPANLVHDGSEEVLAGFPDVDGGSGGIRERKVCKSDFGIINDDGWQPKAVEQPSYAGSGSAARFFYTAKADADDRLGSKHPTVKPLDLMQYLCRLITPSGGTVLDCFAGTGTTLEAAWREGFRSIGIEREPEYQADIVKRMGLCLSGPEERRAASVTQLPPDDLPMFGGGI